MNNNLESLKNLYLSIYGNQEKLDEISVNFGGQAAVDKVRSAMASQRQSAARIDALRTQRFGSGGSPSAGMNSSGRVKADTRPVTSTPKPAAPTQSSTLSTAAQNTVTRSVVQKPTTSTATPATSSPKPPTPAIGKLGNTSFERRTPTSAELRAAQAARAGGASPEKALQAAQKTNLPTTGPSVDLANARTSVAADLAKANSPAVINRPAPTGTALAAQQKKSPMKEQSQEWPSAKTIRDIADAYASIYEAKKEKQNPWWDDDGDGIGYEEGEVSGKFKKKKKKKVKEETQLVDEKYMGFKKLKASIASKGGVSDPGAVAASIGRKKYGKETFQKAAAKGKKLSEAYETYEIIASYLLENNFAETVSDANVIINNMSESWFDQILQEYN